MLRFSLVALLAAAALVPSAAHAGVVVAGTGEPQFTNSATNTHWVSWTGTSPYRISYAYNVDNVLVHTEGPYSQPANGSGWVNWSGVPGVGGTLVEGKTYGICASGQWSDGTLWFADGASSCAAPASEGKRSSTTIDRTKPTIGVSLPAVTRETSASLHIDYADALAHPYGVAFVGVDGGTYEVLPGCAPEDADDRTTSFDCTVNLPAADGPHQVCAIVPDAAVPDNPSSSNQGGTAAQANLSTPACADIVLDRAAPQIAVAGPSEVAVGEPVTLTAQAADGGSGIAAGTAAWSFGDGSAPVGGLQATRTFTTSGTYTVRFAITDAAGNAAEATKQVRVVAAHAAPTGGGPAGAGAGSGGTTTPGASGAQGDAARPLFVRVAGIRRVRGGRRVLRLTVGAAGTANVVLRRGKRIVASRRLAIRHGRVTLPLPSRMVAGTHAVAVSVRGTQGTARLWLPGAKAKARASSRPVIDSRGLTPRLP